MDERGSTTRDLILQSELSKDIRLSYRYFTTESGIRSKTNNALTDKAKLSKGNRLPS